MYHHFGGKKGLLVAVGEGLEQFILHEVFATAAQLDSRRQNFESGIIETLEICAKPDIQRIVFQYAPTVVGAKEWRKIEIKYAFGSTYQTIVALSEAGVLALDDPDLAARILLGAFIEAAHSVAFSNDASTTLNNSINMLSKI